VTRRSLNRVGRYTLQLPQCSDTAGRSTACPAIVETLRQCTGREGLLERCSGVLPQTVGTTRGEGSRSHLSVADRGPMGVRLPCGDCNPALFRQRQGTAWRVRLHLAAREARPIRLARRSPTLGACTTCTTTSTSGAGISMTRIAISSVRSEIPVAQPAAPAAGAFAPGSWYWSKFACRSAVRKAAGQVDRYGGLGFRVVYLVDIPATAAFP